MLCLQESGDCLREQMRSMMRSLQDLKVPRPAPPVRLRACRQRIAQRERRARSRISDVSDVSSYDSAVCLEEEELCVGGAGGGSPSSQRSLESDSGCSDDSWPDEGVVLRRSKNIRVSSSACLRTNQIQRVRPKSTSCLENWTSEDWTTSLLTRGRNRQPLVLGDNSFADLVHNWMDLPEFPEQTDRKHKAKDFFAGISRRLAGLTRTDGRRKSSDAAKLSTSFLASKRLSCQVDAPHRTPFFYKSHTGLNQLDTDFPRFTALMKSGSRTPIVCNDIVGYI